MSTRSRGLSPCCGSEPHLVEGPDEPIRNAKRDRGSHLLVGERGLLVQHGRSIRRLGPSRYLLNKDDHA